MRVRRHWKKAKVLLVFFSIILGKIILRDFYFLTTGSNWRKLKIVGTDVRAQFVDLMGKKVTLKTGTFYNFWRDKSTKWANWRLKTWFLVPLKQIQLSNAKYSTKSFWLKIYKKARGTPRFLSIFSPDFFGDFYFSTVRSDWGKLKMVETDVCCSISQS